MRAYLAIFSARFRTLLQYRAAAWAGFVTQTFWGLIRSMIFLGFYSSTTTPQPLSLEQVITYIWLGQALLAMLPWNIDRDVATMIRTGNIAYELVRPLELYRFWFCRALAMRTAPVLLRAVPMVVVAGVLFPLIGADFLALSPPRHPVSGLLFALSMLAALLLSCAVTVLTSATLVLTISGEGVAQLLPVAVMILSGLIIPLPFLPEWLQPVIALLPFRGLMDVPFRIYLAHITPAAALGEIGLQLFWIAALVTGSRWLLGRALKRVSVQGG